MKNKFDFGKIRSVFGNGVVCRKSYGWFGQEFGFGVWLERFSPDEPFLVCLCFYKRLLRLFRI